MGDPKPVIEWSKSEREKYHVLMLIDGISRNEEVETQRMDCGGTVGKGESGADGESGTDMCVHCHT